jgi:hypothetical protein
MEKKHWWEKTKDVAKDAAKIGVVTVAGLVSAANNAQGQEDSIKDVNAKIASVANVPDALKHSEMNDPNYMNQFVAKATPEPFLGQTLTRVKTPDELSNVDDKFRHADSDVTIDPQTGLPVKNGIYAVSLGHTFPVAPEQKATKVDLSKEKVSTVFSLEEPGLITEINKVGPGAEVIPVSGLSSYKQHSLNHEKHPAYDPLKIQSQKLKTKNQDGMVDGTYVLKYLQEKNLFGKCLTEGDLNAIAQNGIEAFHELLKKYNITEIAAWSAISETEGKMTHDDLKSDASDASVLVLTESNGEMVISGRKIKGYLINQFFEAISPDNTESNLTANK